ncbi:MAG TPA: hypothetical protein VG604_03575 [Candidatus Saccharimonadales bacterium]|nr:hypothetical protein [Candidatus Saccharimonadales bacterium]
MNPNDPLQPGAMVSPAGAPADPNAPAAPYVPPAIVSAADPRTGLAPTVYAASALPEGSVTGVAPAPAAEPATAPAATVPLPPAPAAYASTPAGIAPDTLVTPTTGGLPPTPPVSGIAPVPGAVTPKTNVNSTQNTLQIAEIRDGIVIMNDGSFRSVLMVKSINFDLMSPQEQEAVEYSYQGFLNSLYFPIQIFIRSRRVDLRPYIEKLDKIRSEHDNMLLAMLMEDYIDYMDALSQETNIMDKNFYVVIPYYPVIETQQILTQNKNFLAGITKIFDKTEQHVVINEADLEKAKDELRNRVQSVLAGLQQCGIQGLPLDTQELIELYYDTYNPDTATRQELKNFGSLTSDVVTKGEGTAPKAHLQGELQ